MFKFFFSLLITFYLVLLFLEMVFDGFVSNNFDLNIFLVLALVFCSILVIFPLISLLRSVRQVLSKRALITVLIVIMAYGFLLGYPKLVRLTNRDSKLASEPVVLDVVAEPSSRTVEWGKSPSATDPDKNLRVLLLDGGSGDDTILLFRNALLSKGYKTVIVGKSDRKFEGASIIFHSENEGQAQIIKNILEKEYRSVTAEPSTTSYEVTVILGSK